jgi:hypothetical protein
MRFLRKLVLLAAVGVGSAVLAGPAFATPPDPSLAYAVGSTHFVVHFTTDSINSQTFAITATQAGDIAALAERAYTAETADGYAAPPSDIGLGLGGADNRIDIYVQSLVSIGEAGEADPLAGPGPSPGYMLIDAKVGQTYHVIAHELFHLIQFGVFATNATVDMWLYEAAAEWMGYRVDGYGTAGGTQPIRVGNNDFSLNCRDLNWVGGIECAPSVYYDNGYSRWAFFEYLSELYGPSFVKDIFAQLASSGPSTSLPALSAALAAKGATLADTYNGWATTELNGKYTIKALQGLKPAAYATVSTGVNSGAISVPRVSVNHLATRFVKFTRGDDDLSHLCYSATLNLSVAIPAGTQSKPAFYWNGTGSSPVQLAVSGNTATAAIPWDTCTYKSNAGWLSLPNASTSVDAADFVVTASLTVDTTNPTSPTPPPDGVTTTTPVIQVTAADVAPTLFLFGPEILRLTSQETKLRLIVESSGQGTVQAKLGSVVLGTVSVRAGNNDLRFTIPSSLLRALRRSAASGNVLTLTPTSPNGATIGQAVTRTVSVLPPKVKRHRK